MVIRRRRRVTVHRWHPRRGHGVRVRGMEPVRIVRVRRRAVGVQIVTNVAGLVDDGGWVRSRGRAAVPPPVRVRGRRVRWVRHHAVRVDNPRKVMTSVDAVVVVVAFAVRRWLADIRGIAMGAAVVPRRQKTAQVVSVGRRRHRRRRLPHPFVGGFHPRRRRVEIPRVPPPRPPPPPPPPPPPSSSPPAW